MIPDADLARAKAIPIADVIGAEVPLRPKGREFAGLCPFHTEKTPSFYVAPDKGFWHCFGCGAHGDVIGFVMRRRGFDFVDAVRWLLDLPPNLVPVSRSAKFRPPPKYETEARTSARVQAIIRECVPATRGTAAAFYLWSRGLGDHHPALMSHPALYCSEVGKPLAALVAPITASDGRVTAVQRIWTLDRIESVNGAGPQDARAALVTRKKTLGPMLDGAARLAPVGQILGLAEGVESAIAASILYRIPVWSLCGLSRLGYPAHWSEGVGERRHWIAPDAPPQGVSARWFDERAPSLWIPPDVRGLWIFGDCGFIGETVAEYAAGWWRQRGIAAEAIFPREGFGDFNDQLLGKERGV